MEALVDDCVAPICTAYAQAFLQSQNQKHPQAFYLKALKNILKQCAKDQFCLHPAIYEELAVWHLLTLLRSDLSEMQVDDHNIMSLIQSNPEAKKFFAIKTWLEIMAREYGWSGNNILPLNQDDPDPAVQCCLSVLAFLRVGRMEEAVEAAKKANRPWLAAVLADGAYTNPGRKLWRQSISVYLSNISNKDDEELSLTRCILGIAVGHLPVIEWCGMDWRDRLWAQSLAALDACIESLDPPDKLSIDCKEKTFITYLVDALIQERPISYEISGYKGKGPEVLRLIAHLDPLKYMLYINYEIHGMKLV